MVRVSLLVVGFQTDAAGVCQHFTALPSAFILLQRVLWWLVVFYFLTYYPFVDVPVFITWPLLEVHIRAQREFIRSSCVEC